MSIRAIRAAALAAAPVALIAAGISPAAADSQRFQYADCVSGPTNGTQVCLEGEGRVHVTTTKSGNVGVTLRGAFSQELRTSSGEVLAESSLSAKLHARVKQGELHVFTFKGDGVAAGDGKKCPFTVRVHYANGAVRVAHWGVACES